MQEQMDSQVDVRDCVAEVLSPFGVRMLSSVLKWNVDLLAVQQPAVLESVCVKAHPGLHVVCSNGPIAVCV